jgi:hypothetical protein
MAKAMEPFRDSHAVLGLESKTENDMKYIRVFV